MKASIIITFLFLIASTNSQYFGWYQSASSFLEIGQLEAFFKAFNQPLTIPDTSITWQANAVTNISNVAFTLKYNPVTWSIISQPSFKSVIASTGETTLFVGTLSFNFDDMGVFVGTNGNATVEIYSTLFLYNKTINSGQAPNFSCLFVVNLDFNNLILSNGMGTSAQTNVKNILDKLVIPSISNVVQNSLNDQCNGFYQAEATYWQSSANYIVDSPLALFNFNSQLSLTNFDSNGLVFQINGTVGDAIAQQIFNDSTFNSANGKIQYAYTLQSFQGWVDEFFDRGYYSLLFNNANFFIAAFDYTIADLSNIISDLSNHYAPLELVDIKATYVKSPTLTIDPIAQALVATCNLTLYANLASNGSQLFTVNMPFNLTIQAVFNAGTLDFKIKTAAYDSSKFQISQPVTSNGLAYLTFYLNSGLANLKSVKLTYGSSFNIYGALISNPVVSWSNGSLYLLD